MSSHPFILHTVQKLLCRLWIHTKDGINFEPFLISYHPGPTLKLKRPIVNKMYKAEIDGLYEDAATPKD